MNRKSGLAAQQRVWEETKEELLKNIPELKAVYGMLDDE